MPLLETRERQERDKRERREREKREVRERDYQETRDGAMANGLTYTNNIARDS